MKRLFFFLLFTIAFQFVSAKIVCEPFSLTDVHLLPSRFQENMKRDSAWMMSIPVERLLHSFRNTAGVYSSREGGYMTLRKMGGWESLDCDLRGHITGHLLSALSTLYAQTGSSIVKAKSDSIINGLDEVQRQYGSGYLSAFGEGLIDRNIQGKGVWAPWYTLHKLVQGLIDQYCLCHNDTALAIAQRMGTWAYNKLKPLDDKSRQLMIRNEFGGFNEAMYELYQLTPRSVMTYPGNVSLRDQFLWVARFFYHSDKVDPLKKGDNRLGTNHANTFIPKLLGEARNYELFGDLASRQASELLFYTLTKDHAFVTGEVSDKEHLFSPSAQNEHLSGYDGENCCTFNLLKLADHIFSWTADEGVAEYYERALYNHVLGQQDPCSSMVTYFTPLQTGTYRLYSTRDSSYWCCVGSGFESHVKYASSIYFHNDNQLYVNLFVPSVVDWKGTKLTQRTHFPEDGMTEFIVSGKSRHFSLMLRHPKWTSSITIKVNGREIKSQSRPGTYQQIERQWKDGDKVTATYAMPLHEEAVKGDTTLVALLKGPIVLGGELDSVANPYSDPHKYNDYYTYDYQVPQSLPAKCTYTSLSQFRKISSLNYKSLQGIVVKPFFDIHHHRYVVYWKKK